MSPESFAQEAQVSCCCHLAPPPALHRMYPDQLVDVHVHEPLRIDDKSMRPITGYPLILINLAAPGLLFMFRYVQVYPLLVIQSQMKLAQFDEPEDQTCHCQTQSPLAQCQSTRAEGLVE